MRWLCGAGAPVESLPSPLPNANHSMLLLKVTAIRFPQHVLALGIGAAVADEFVAARSQPLTDLRAGFEHRRIDVVGARQRELVEEVEVIPEPDPVAVVAPRVVALALRRGGAGRIAAEPAAKRKPFDVVVEDDREPLPFGPVVLRPVGDRHVAVAVVRGELHWGVAGRLRMCPSP